MDGIIVINKHKGCTSHDIVYKVKKVFNEKVGHTGTLDPMATGVLPLLIGKGTLCSKYLINHDKTYRVNLQLGKKTDTADSEGNIIEEREVNQENLEKDYIKEVLKKFVGKQNQIPPIYSAIKVNGKKLYEYARKGQSVSIEPRNIEIYNIQLLDIDNNNNQLKFQVSCSKGTYIRSLCEDIAKRLGTVGYMLELERLRVGDFKIENSITIQELMENKDTDTYIKEHFISLEKIFKESDTIKLDDRKLKLFLNGVKLTQKSKDGIYKIYCNNKFIGTGTVEKGLLKRDIIL
ncbi:MAG: tRNA pseudouridine(55) synthase TruB [Clostridia bacterium]|nr:tRNA pseudouridine(55) synthase TruB [Clostridia bacterium]